MTSAQAKAAPAPAPPLVAPPRGPLQVGDPIALYSSYKQGHDHWLPYRYAGQHDRVPRLSLFTDVLRQHLTLSLDRLSYGDPTGLPRDLGVNFWRYPDEVWFMRLCPNCRGAGGLDEPYCAMCENAHMIPSAPFTEPYEHVMHYKSPSQALAGIFRRFPNGIPESFGPIVAGVGGKHVTFVTAKPVTLK